MTYLISTLVVLSVLILIHEAGHFFAAKWVGIQVPRFSLGLGPKVWGFRRGETEYVLSAIPLGGYVKMAGMEDDEAAEALEGGRPDPDEPPVDPARTFDSKPIWARVLVISAGVIMNWLFAVLIFAVLAWAWGAPFIRSTQLAPAAPAGATGPAAEAAKVPYGARVLAVGGEPVDSYNAFAERLDGASAGPLTLTLDGGRTATLSVPADAAARRELVRALRPLREPVLGQVLSSGPAARAGLRVGDRIVAVGGAPVRIWEEVVQVVRASPGKPLRLTVQREGRPLEVAVTPVAERERDAEGNPVEVGKLGIGDRTEMRRAGLLEGLGIGFQQTWATTKLIAVTLGQLFTGQLSPRSMGGLLTIGQASGESAEQGLDVWLAFLALFSVNLAVLNLLPIPILDGGHLMFLAIEAVRGRPLSVEARIRFSQVGLIIVVGLMLWANGNDVVRLVEQYLGG